MSSNLAGGHGINGPEAIQHLAQIKPVGALPKQSGLPMPATEQPPGPPSQEPPPTLSATAQALSALLSELPEPAPLPINGGRPLLPTVPTQHENTPALLANALATAIASSGLFYESHIARWADGKFPLLNLQQETKTDPASSPSGLQGAPNDETTAPADDHNESPAITLSEKEPALTKSADEQHKLLVRQQMEILNTNQVVFTTQPFPGMRAEIKISKEDPNDSRGPQDQGDPIWRTSIELELPSLGPIRIDCDMLGRNIAVRIRSQYAEALSAEKTELETALSKHGMQAVVTAEKWSADELAG